MCNTPIHCSLVINHMHTQMLLQFSNATSIFKCYFRLMYVKMSPRGVLIYDLLTLAFLPDPRSRLLMTTKKIFLWTAPRCVSTAFEFEPYNAPYYAEKFYEVPCVYIERKS